MSDHTAFSMELEGRHALVTGATSGIGRAAAVALAGAGAVVSVSGRDTTRGNEAVGEFESRGGRAVFIAADLIEQGAAERLVRESVAVLGPLDVVVASAGVIHPASIFEISDDQWRHTMAVNLDAVFATSRAAVREMRDRGGSVVLGRVHVSERVVYEREGDEC